MSFGTILITIVMFCALIFVHELGHFVFAKLSGVAVNEFSLGMGPVLLKKVAGGTQYSLRLFPIGGYCAMEGEVEDGSTDHTQYEGIHPKGIPFPDAALWKRILITIGGPLMNVFLGFLLAVLLSSQAGAFGTTMIHSFDEKASSNAWLQAGDEILRMNGHRVRSYQDVIYELSRDRDGVMDIEVLRGDQKLLLPAVTFQMDAVEDNIHIVRRDFFIVPVPKTPMGVLTNSVNYTVFFVKQVWGSLVDLVTGRFTLNQVSGPVGMTSAVGEAASQGWKDLVNLVAFISVNLGVFNLLPVPALDGGRLLFLLIEGVRRKPIPAKYEGLVHGVGFMLLIGLIIVVTFKDVMRLIWG